MSFFEFPHTRTYDTDLGWIIKHLGELLQDTAALQAWAGEHKEQYKELADKVEGLINNLVDVIVPWDSSIAYHIFSIVEYQGTNYIAVQDVPVGAMITNTDYWQPANTVVEQINAIGTISSDLQNLGNYTTPQKYGAKADGITDDTDAIKAAVNAFITKDEIIGVFFPAGTYLLSDHITIPSGCKILGEGNQTVFTITSNYGSNKLFYSYNTTDIEIKDISVDMINKTFAALGNVTRGIFAFENVNGLIMDGVKSVNNKTDDMVPLNQPIWLQSCSNVEIKNCYIEHNGTAALENGNGIWIFSKNSNSEHISIHDNIITGYGDELIAVGGSNDYYASDVHIYNNYLESRNEFGVTFVNFGTNDVIIAKDIFVHHNIFHGSCLFTSASVYNVSVHDNIFEENLNYTGSKHTFVAFDSSAQATESLVRICNNTFTMAGKYYMAIRILAHYQASEIKNNKIVSSDNTTDSAVISAQYFEGFVTDNIILGGYKGIIIGRNIQCTGNKIQTVNYGIAVINTGFIIKYNRIDGAQYGILINASYNTFSTIDGNDFFNITDRPVKINANANSGIRLLVANNRDYHSQDAARNMVSVAQAANYQLFGNYQYRTGAYSWTADDNKDA